MSKQDLESDPWGLIVMRNAHVKYTSFTKTLGRTEVREETGKCKRKKISKYEPLTEKYPSKGLIESHLFDDPITGSIVTGTILVN